MIIIKSKREIELMREPCKVTAELLHDLADYIRPGISTMDVNDFVEKRIEVYEESTAPLIDYYKKAGTLRNFNAEKDPEEVFAEIVAEIGE